MNTKVIWLMVQEAGRSENLALASAQHLVRVSLLLNRAEDVTEGESAASPGLSSSSYRATNDTEGAWEGGTLWPYLILINSLPKGPPWPAL